MDTLLRRRSLTILRIAQVYPVAVLGLILLTFASSCSLPRESIQDRATVALLPLQALQVFGEFSDPAHVSIDQFGDIYIVDRGRSLLIKYNALGDSLRSVGGVGSGAYEFQHPLGVDARLSNHIYVVDNGNRRIQEYSRDLAFARSFTGGENDEIFGFPIAAAIDRAQRLYVIDGANARLLRLKPSGGLDVVVGDLRSANRPEGLLQRPTLLTTDQSNRVIAVDRSGPAIAVYDEFGSVLARSNVESGSEAKALACSGDTLFVLHPREIGLYSIPALSLIAKWFPAIDGDGFSAASSEQLRGIAVRDGMVILLTDRRGVRCVLPK